MKTLTYLLFVIAIATGASPRIHGQTPVQTVRSMPTVAALKGLPVISANDGLVVEVTNYTTAGDLGGGLFRYSSSSSTADNGGTVIAPNGGSGRWLRVYSGPLNVKWFGAKGDATTNDTAAIQAALDAGAQNTVFLPPGTYRVLSGLSLPDGITFIGSGNGGSGIGASGAEIRADTGFSGDAVLYAKNRDNGNVNSWVVVKLENLGVRFVFTPGSEVAALDMTGMRHSRVDHVQLWGPGEATSSIALRIADNNPTNTSPKTSFFNLITNVQATNGGWGTALMYRQTAGNANSNRVIGFDASCAQAMDFTSAENNVQGLFAEMYFASVTGGANQVVKNGVFPYDATFIRVNGEGFSSTLNYIALRTTAATGNGEPGYTKLSSLDITGYGPHTLRGRIENYPDSYNNPFGFVGELLAPKYEAVAMPWGGFGRNQNYLTYSEQLDNAAWAKVNMTVAANATTDPTGATTGDKITSDTGTTGDNISQSVSPGAVLGNTYIFSAWVKNGNLGANERVVLRIEAGGVTELTVSPSADWNRYMVSITGTGGGSTLIARIRFQGHAIGSNVYVWGAQVEQSSNMGAYVSTTATAQTTIYRTAVFNAGIRIGDVLDISGTGVPSAALPNGSTYRRTDGGGGFYVRESGAWVAK